LKARRFGAHVGFHESNNSEKWWMCQVYYCPEKGLL
jgi:hypothetical protein